MAVVDTEAVILRTYKLAEADKIVVCLTKSEGTVRGVARGARRMKSRFGASLEPFTHAAVNFYSKEGRELVTFSRIEIIKSNFKISSEPEAVATLEYFGQLIIEFAPPHQADERLFRLFLACIDSAVAHSSTTASLRPYFELWILKLNGFLPDLQICGRCGVPLISSAHSVSVTVDGQLHCRECVDGSTEALAPIVHRQLLSMNQLAPTEWARNLETLPENARRDLARFANQLVLRALEKQSVGRRSLSDQDRTILNRRA